ncbi:FCD domain-containing protein [Alpinimonas psychrophila]|uniref:DNA-binding FadR family transcriptional regulator n=1 Tax=Alpinimonas psychrophila TaxID=748908 RepID=A0A7W3JS46_9MICO|nr:FCD domain-containing protein [Alpinimonas psychrophila]MBA8828238.1 DNA-binding FadR family transcriptional regulator [Alpinimonas psychrophila]
MKELLLRPVRGGNAFEETIERLLQTIRLGLASPGDQLPPERELAAMLEVSRDTVREAISSLVDAHYLVVRRGRYGGTFVVDVVPSGAITLGRDGELLTRTHFTPAEIADILVLREILETGAARHASVRALSAAEREQLWAVLGESRTANDSDYRRLDSRLHLFIAELTGSSTLLAQVAHCRMRINELLDGIPLLSPNIAHSNEQHEQIVLAILTGDAQGAEAAMRDHVSGSASLLRGFLA